MNTSELQKLTEMLQQGKITPEQYEELRKALEDSASAAPRETTPPPRHSAQGVPPPGMAPLRDMHEDAYSAEGRPWQIWTVTVILTIASLAQLAAGLRPGRGGLLLAGIIDLAMAAGIFYYSRVAYVVLGVGGVIATLVQLVRGNIAAAILDAILLWILFSAYRYFFEAQRPEASRQDSSSTPTRQEW